MKKLIVLTLIAALVAFVYVGAAKAKEANEPEAKMVTVKGKVMVTKDAEGKVMAVMLHHMMNKINTTLDSKGMELGEKMEGKMVEVTGMEMTKDGQKWLTVEKYSEVEKKEGEKPKE
jgi:uncharacterized membrane protein